MAIRCEAGTVQSLARIGCEQRVQKSPAAQHDDVDSRSLAKDLANLRNHHPDSQMKSSGNKSGRFTALDFFADSGDHWPRIDDDRLICRIIPSLRQAGEQKTL